MLCNMSATSVTSGLLRFIFSGSLGGSMIVLDSSQYPGGTLLLPDTPPPGAPLGILLKQIVCKHIVCLYVKSSNRVK